MMPLYNGTLRVLILKVATPLTNVAVPNVFVPPTQNEPIMGSVAQLHSVSVTTPVGIAVPAVVTRTVKITF